MSESATSGRDARTAPPTGDRAGRAPEKKPQPRPPSSSGISAGRAARAALEQFRELGRHHIEGVVAVEPDNEGWCVVIEVVEDEHVPSTADIMAEYEVQLDHDGDLTGFRRTRRYVRGRAGNHA